MYLHLAWQASIHPLFYRGQYFVKHLSKYINNVVSSPFLFTWLYRNKNFSLVWVFAPVLGETIFDHMK